MKPEETQTNYLYTWRTIECFHSIGPHADGIGPALGRQSVLQMSPPVSWLWDTNYPPISGDPRGPFNSKMKAEKNAHEMETIKQI